MSLEKLVAPQNVAVIGASANHEKIGFQIMNNLVAGGFGGQIFPVNPKEETILNIKCYPSVVDIPAEIDLAVIVIPAKLVLGVVGECGSKGVKSIAVISAGFSETDSDGLEREKQLVLLCREKGITLLGPNCLGVINSFSHLNASFASAMPAAGNIGLFSQSGAMISSFVDWSNSAGAGFSTILSLGNKAELTEAQVLQYFYEDTHTSVILGYVEGFRVSSELTRVLQENAHKKPTIFLVGGQSQLGEKAAKSHTGAIISSYLSTKTYLEQAGIIVAENLTQLFAYAKMFSAYQSITAKNLAVITNAGGLGIMAADSMAKNQLSLPSLDNLSELRSSLRPEASVHNPIDVLGDATVSEYEMAIDAALNSAEISGVLVIVTPQTATDIGGIAKMLSVKKGNKPVAATFVGGKTIEVAASLLKNSAISLFDAPDQAVTAFRALANFSLVSHQIGLPAVGNKTFREEDKSDILAAYSIPSLQYYTADNETSLQTAIQKCGYPVVVKVANSSGHKSDSGGVRLNITDWNSVLSAAKTIGFPVIVGRMIKAQHEIFVGVRRDPAVGIVVAFGTGGIYSEIYKDFSYRVAPVSVDEAKIMISETIVGQILLRPRGEEPWDIETLATIVSNIVQLVSDYSNIQEVDFNPIIASNGEYGAVDVRVISN